MGCLGYTTWRRFKDAINRAMESCKSAEIEVSDHFADAVKMVEIGSNAVRDVLIFRERKQQKKGEKQMNRIYEAKREDKQEILNLYRTMLYGPADWSEDYPNEKTIEFDLSRNALFIMKNTEGQIIAAISIDADEEVEKLACWNKKLFPSAEVSRLCVREDMQNCGLAKEMMHFVFDHLKKEGKKGVHILVKTGHKIALASYRAIGFETVGECNLFGKDFVCMEKKI